MDCDDSACICHDALRHVRPPEGNSGVFTRLPKFSALRYGRHAQDAGRYGRFTPARRSALDRFAVAALKIAYVLAVMASIFGLAVHFFSVKLGSKDILNIVFVVLGLCVIFLKVLHHRKTYLRWVRDKVIKR